MSNTVTYYILGIYPVEQVEALMMWLIVDDLMTKLNNLTNGKMVLSNIKFGVGNQDETKTAITNTNHTQYIHIYKHCIKKAHNAWQKREYTAYNLLLFIHFNIF
jgi:hypothetical protein